MLLTLQLTMADGCSPSAWMPMAVRCVRCAAICGVSPPREFELLPLWLFIIELVAHDSWLLEDAAAAEALQAPLSPSGSH